MEASLAPAAAGNLRLGRAAQQHAPISLPAVRWAVAMAAGIVASELVPGAVGVWTMVLAGAGFVACLPGENFLRSGAAGLCAAAAMAIWATAHQGPGAESRIVELAADQWQPTVLRAEIASPVERRPDRLAQQRTASPEPQYQSLVELAALQVRRDGRWTPTSGRIRAVVDGDVSDLRVGDEVTAYGHLQRIQPPTNPGAVDMREIFAARGIYVHMHIGGPTQICLEREGPWSPPRLISAVAVRGEQVLHRSVGEEAAPLASALVLGRRQAVDARFRDRLLETGTIHLLSVSGMHLGMVALAVSGLVLLTGWSRGWQVGIILAVCVFYAALTGAQPPVLRASMLVGALLLGRWAGRHAHPLNSLGIAAIVLMILNPNNLWQSGVQLSFIAVATLVVAGRSAVGWLAEDPQLDPLVRATRSRWVNLAGRAAQRTATAAVLSFWVWVITAPLVWHGYNILSPIAVLANVLMSIPLFLALLSGIVTASLGMVSEVAAVPTGWLCRGAIEGMRWIVETCGAVPYGYVWFPGPPAWWVVVFYGVLGAVLLLPRSWLPAGIRRWRWMIAWVIVWFLAAVPLATRPLKPLEDSSIGLTFVDVGHGTSVLVELGDGRGRWLYDAGRLGDPVWSASPIQDVLWSQGIGSLDGILISHADADHYNAVPDLLRRFRVGRLVTTPGLLGEEQPGLDPLRVAVREAGTPVSEVHAGMRVGDATGEHWARVLHPERHGPYASSDNARSMVLVLEQGGTSLVLPGDLEMPGTEHVIRSPRPAPGGLLMAPHHGSIQQDARPVLDWTRPSVVVISGSRRADRPEVRRMWGQGGAETLVTADAGAVRVEIDREGQIHVWHWHVDHWRLISR